MIGAGLLERACGFLGSRMSRRNFIVRSTFAATALSVAPGRYVMRPGTAYEAFCGEPQCGSAGCSCASRCCEGYSTFCCSINDGYNYCPEGTIVGGWWAAQDSSYCGDGTRYYLDCNAVCHCHTGCGGGWSFCEQGACDDTSCHCAGGSCNNWVTGCYQFRYGQCNHDVACCGAIVCRIVSCTPPWQLDLDCDNTWMQDNSTAEMSAPCNTATPEPPPPACHSPRTRCKVVAFESDPAEGGYWLATSFGRVLAFGAAKHHGDESAAHLRHPIVDMRASPNGAGYWLVAADGGVFSFGSARFHGSTAGEHLRAPIVGMAPTPDGGGYWLVAADGGVFTHGNARFHGSLGGKKGIAQVTGVEATLSGRGYWIVAEDGGVFSFGDAKYRGNPIRHHPARPVVALRRSAGGLGYYILDADGTLWAFGDAKYHGEPHSSGGFAAVGLALGVSGLGYWVALADGAIFSFGKAVYHGGGN